MTDDRQRQVRYGEAFWTAHHEAWQRSALNWREYCEAQGIPLKAFGNLRAWFKTEPQAPVPAALSAWRAKSPKSHGDRLSHT